MTMKKDRFISQQLMWFAMMTLICGVIATGILTNITLRSIQKNIPIKLLAELNDLSLVLENLSEVVHAAEIAKTQTNAKNLNLLRDKVETVFKNIVELRESYVFDNLVQASAFHAVVAPAIADLKAWLSEGVSGFGPDTETTAAIVFLRINKTFQKARSLNRASKIRAQKILEEQRKRLDHFLFSANLFFALTVLVTFSMVYLLIRQYKLQQREATTQAELHDQRDLLNSLFENVMLGITVWDREGTLLISNRGFMGITGYSTEHIKTLEDWFPRAYPDPEYRSKVMLDWKESSGQKSAIREFKVTCKNGEVKDIEFRGTFLSDGRALVTMSDITVRKQAEEDQRRLEAQLHHAHKMESIGTLAGGIAHDFNNVIGIILGNAELALEDVPEWNPAKLNLKEIQTASLRAKDVVRQLLSFARKTGIEKKPTNIVPIVKESLKLLRSSIPTSVEIRQNIMKDVDIILADSTQINQVLINLCTNADHAMPDGGIIEVTLRNKELDRDTAAQHPELHPGRYVNLIVSDTGCGIPKETYDRIFDPYFTTKEVGRGTGMGLAVVHGIVQGHNGFITVESELGKGTIFNIFFPTIEKDAAPVENETAKELPTGNEKILFVDDEESIVKLGHLRLERLGYNVEATTHPIEALNLFRSQADQFDLVITDLTMPQMTGDKLVKEILKIRPDIPIILCTGFSEKIDEAKAKALGASDYIEKPLDKRDFALKVRKVLNETGG